MLSLVPADHGGGIYLDIRSILGDPVLKEALERQGVLAVLGPIRAPLEERADGLVLAQRGGVALGILRGPLDAEELIDTIKAPGSVVEPEDYGGFEIQTVQVVVPFLSLIIPISLRDDTTAIFAISLNPENPGINSVKAALDTVEGSNPGLLSDPAVNQLVEAIPWGFATFAANDCGRVGRLEGCTGLAISAVKAGEDGVIHWAFGFSDPELARGAFQTIAARVEGLAGPSVSFKDIESSLEANIIRLRATVDISDVLEAVLGRGLP